MKFVLLLALFTTIVFADHEHDFKIKTIEEMRKAEQDCEEELKLSDEDKEYIKKDEYPDKESIHKYIYCTSLKLGLFDDAHGFHLEHLVDQFGQNKDKNEVREKISKCLDKNEQKSSVEVWAYRNCKCMDDSHIFDHAKKTYTNDQH